MMERLKNYLISTLGWFGYVLFLSLQMTFYILIVFPGMLFLDIPFWVKSIFYVAMFWNPFLVLDLIVQFLVWIISLPFVLFSPFDIFSLWYYICFAYFLITTVILPIVKIIQEARQNGNEEKQYGRKLH